jgi:hypothetical protein
MIVPAASLVLSLKRSLAALGKHPLVIYDYLTSPFLTTWSSPLSPSIFLSIPDVTPSYHPATHRLLRSFAEVPPHFIALFWRFQLHLPPVVNLPG